MKDNTESRAAPTGTCPGKVETCGVSEAQFPQIGKCCLRVNAPGGADYKGICPYCTVWISPPDPSSLDVAAIFECKRLRYCKRIKNI